VFSVKNINLATYKDEFFIVFYSILPYAQDELYREEFIKRYRKSLLNKKNILK